MGNNSTNSIGAENLRILSYGNKAIRTIIINNEPWWVLKDVCDILELSNPSVIVNRLDDDEKTKVDPKQYLGSKSNIPTTIINESGLYNVILLSRKKEAKRFKRWVTHEVLPQIRLTGGYIPTTESDTPELIMAKALKIADNTIKEKENKILELQSTIEQNKPLVEFSALVQGQTKNILVREMSKLASNYTGVDIGEKGLYQKLRDWKFVCKRKNEPTKLAYLQGVLEYVERKIPIYPYVSYTTMVTPKGQFYIANRLLKEKRKQEVVA